MGVEKLQLCLLGAAIVISFGLVIAIMTATAFLDWAEHEGPVRSHHGENGGGTIMATEPAPASTSEG